jgi:hypothetical protein
MISRIVKILVVTKSNYSLLPILFFTHTGVTRHILMLDISVFMKGNIDQKE